MDDLPTYVSGRRSWSVLPGLLLLHLYREVPPDDFVYPVPAFSAVQHMPLNAGGCLLIDECSTVRFEVDTVRMAVFHRGSNPRPFPRFSAQNSSARIKCN